MARLSDSIADATAPLVVANALGRLARQFGTERVLAAVKAWVEFIETTKPPTAGSDRRKAGQ